MNLLLQGHDYEYEMKMLLNLFYPDEVYQIVEEVATHGMTIEACLDESRFRVTCYKDGIEIAAASVGQEILLELPEESHLRKKEKKKLLKKLLYDVANKVTDKEQPWGILTGIRPTKIVFELIERYGFDEAIIRRHLRDTYRISHEKIDLMMEIATYEWPILKQNTEDQINIYIGIPFCPTRCLYCSFTSYPIDKWERRVNEYLDALEAEMKYVSSSLLKGKKLKTIYVGGGTPTSLHAKGLERLMKMIHHYFPVASLEELTVEAGRPDTITKEKLQILHQYKVDRISINPQTMNQKTLDTIGRRHRVEDVLTAFHMAREVGFDNINMDLILGLPGETYEDVMKTMSKVKALEPESLTVHTMAVKRASKLKETIHEYERIRETTIEDMIKLVYDEAKEMGLHPYYMYRQKNMVGNYENVGYCSEGKACIYNVEIMEEAQTILALGAGAISKVVYPSEKRIERIENVKNVEHYIERIDEMIERKQRFFS